MSNLFDSMYHPEVVEVVSDIARRHADVRCATTDEDISGTDMVIPERMFGIRLRHHDYMHKYGHEITLRAAGHRGGPSEVDRILAGRYTAHKMIYGFLTPDAYGVTAYRVVDLSMLAERHAGMIASKARKYNHGDLSSFIAIDVDDIADCVVGGEGFPGDPKPCVQGELW